MSIFISREITVETEVELHSLTDRELLECVGEAESRGLLVKKEHFRLAEKLMAYFRRLHSDSVPQEASDYFWQVYGRMV